MKYKHEINANTDRQKDNYNSQILRGRKETLSFRLSESMNLIYLKKNMKQVWERCENIYPHEWKNWAPPSIVEEWHICVKGKSEPRPPSGSGGWAEHGSDLGSEVFLHLVEVSTTYSLRLINAGSIFLEKRNQVTFRYRILYSVWSIPYLDPPG